MLHAWQPDTLVAAVLLLVLLLLPLLFSTCLRPRVVLHADLQAIAERMASVKNKLLVLSGKGGVGKSTFATQLAFALAAQGKEVRPCMRTEQRCQECMVATGQAAAQHHAGLCM
jgi:hypothetical protein